MWCAGEAAGGMVLGVRVDSSLPREPMEVYNTGA